LFAGAEGVEFFDRHVNRRVEQSPGFENSKTVTERIAKIAL